MVPADFGAQVVQASGERKRTEFVRRVRLRLSRPSRRLGNGLRSRLYLRRLR
jgi:hypothetical protein